jgi:hypothetical protein
LRSTTKGKVAEGQSHLSDFSSIIQEVQVEVEMKAEGLEPQKKVRCPFCLVENAKLRFMHSLKSGKLARKATCPNCKADMLLESLEKEMTLDEFAKWVSEYQGFFKKVDFEKFTKGLWAMGVGKEFWVLYRKYKPKRETDDEGYAKPESNEFEVDKNSDEYKQALAEVTGHES